jgi:hypothetical protein
MSESSKELVKHTAMKTLDGLCHQMSVCCVDMLYSRFPQSSIQDKQEQMGQYLTQYIEGRVLFEISCNTNQSMQTSVHKKW